MFEFFTSDRAGAIGRIQLHRHRIQDVRQWQPHRANLLPAGRDAVEDAPGHDEVGLGVVVAQRQAGAGERSSGKHTDEGRHPAHDTRKDIESAHRRDI